MTFGEYLERAQQFLRDHPEARDLPAKRFDAHCETYEVDSGPSIDEETQHLEVDAKWDEEWVEGVHYRKVSYVAL